MGLPSEYRAKYILVAAIIMLLASCSNNLETGATITLPASTSTPEPETGTFTNPVLDQDFPDPDVLKVGDTYYAYATNSGLVHIQAASSTDLVNWKYLGNVLPSLPTWAVQEFGWAWAPDVTTDASGEGYLMYFTARYKMGQGGTQCIGAATSASPEGPFRSPNPEPLICQTGEGGSIDPASFVDDNGTRYLLWKNDGNSGGGPVYLYIQQVTEDGLEMAGESKRILTNDTGWEGKLIEGPTLWKEDGKYYLLYSANDFNSDRYAVGYATADDILGPYTKPEKDPLIKTTLPAGLVGPGGQDVVVGPKGGTWVLIHGWSPGGYRRLYLEPIRFEDGEAEVIFNGREPNSMP